MGVLYFAYTSRISPEEMEHVAPAAVFQFIAHLPETRLVFPITNGKWKGALPSVIPAPGNTVWGVVFKLPPRDLETLDRAETREGRVRTLVSAMDRTGKRHEVVTHVAKPNGRVAKSEKSLKTVRNGKANGSSPVAANGTASPLTTPPSSDYMRLVVRGCRYWKLPTGWVACLEEYVTR